MRTLQRIANAHPFWSTRLSSANIASALLAVIGVFLFMTGHDSLEQHIPSAVVFIGVSIIGVTAYVCAILVDCWRLYQAHRLVKNKEYFVPSMKQHEKAFMFYLAGVASRGFPYSISDFDSLSHRNQLRFCLEYLKYLRYTKHAQAK